MQTTPEAIDNINKDTNKIVEKKKRKLTLKQRLFVSEYVKRKNGTQAALVAYDTKDPKAASVIATENLDNLSVQEEIKDILNRQGLSLEAVSKDLQTAISSGLGEQAKNSDSLRGIELLLKLHNAFPASKSINATVNLTEAYKDKTHQELIKALEESKQQTQKLLDDLEAK